MTQRRKTEIIIIELSFSCGACHRCIMYWCFACSLALCASAVPRVTGTSDTAVDTRQYSGYIGLCIYFNYTSSLQIMCRRFGCRRFAVAVMTCRRFEFWPGTESITQRPTLACGRGERFQLSPRTDSYPCNKPQQSQLNNTQTTFCI